MPWRRASTGRGRRSPSTWTSSRPRPRASTTPATWATRRCVPGRWARRPSIAVPTTTSSRSCWRSCVTRCTPAPSASRPRSHTTTRPPMTGRLPRGWRNGPRSMRWSARWASWALASSSWPTTETCAHAMPSETTHTSPRSSNWAHAPVSRSPTGCWPPPAQTTTGSR